MTAAHYRDSVVASISGYYKPVPSASVYVYAPGTTTQVTCYSDAATTIPLTQPLAADGSGVLNFYLPAERSVDFLVSGTGIVSSTISNVVVSSPDTLWTGGLTVQGGGETITAGGLNITAGGITVSAGGLTITAGGLTLSAGSITFTELQLTRDAANVLAQVNGTNAQILHIYSTYTDASNFERLNIFANSGGNFGLLSDQAGTGSPRSIQLGTTGSAVCSIFTNNTERWRVNANGHLWAPTDNTYDIGASGANRPRTVYAGTNVNASVSVIAGSNVQITSAFATNIGVLLNSGGSFLYSGSGVPSNATGNNGDFYFRFDGGAGTSIYQRRTGAWVATGA